MQTLPAATMLAALALASTFVAQGATTRQVRPNGVVLSHNGAVLVVRVVG